MRDLARNANRPHPPLFAPVVFGLAAEVDAREPGEMVMDGTRLCRNLLQLARALRLDVVTCAAPSGMEAEALGVKMDIGVWPPKSSDKLLLPDFTAFDEARLVSAPRLCAALDATRQLANESGEHVILAAVTGPATLVAELRVAGWVVDDETAYDVVGRVLASLVRQFAEAGAHVVEWVETRPPDKAQAEPWKGALGTSGNMARFYQIPPLLVIERETPSSWPPQAIACPTIKQHAGALPRAHGRAWSTNPDEWPAFPRVNAPERLVTTAGEVPHDFEIASLSAAFKKCRGDA